MLKFALAFLIPFSFVGLAYGKGLAIDAAAGITSAQITNPDNSIAYYTGIIFQPKVFLPILDDKLYGAFFNLTGRYLTFENNANYSIQRETATHIGPGFGVSGRFARVSFGVDLFYMRARHYLIGSVSGFQEFDYQPTTMYLAYHKPINNTMSLKFSYSKTTATIAKDKADLKSDALYEDTSIFIHLTVETGQDLGKFLKGIFF